MEQGPLAELAATGLMGAVFLFTDVTPLVETLKILLFF